MDLDELAEARAVVVPRRLGVAERLQDGVGVEDLLLEGPRAAAKVVAEVLEDVLGRLRLAGAGLARHDDGLRLLHHLHVPEGLVRDGEHVGRHGAERAALVVGRLVGGRIQVIRES